MKEKIKNYKVFIKIIVIILIILIVFYFSPRIIPIIGGLSSAFGLLSISSILLIFLCLILIIPEVRWWVVKRENILVIASIIITLMMFFANTYNEYNMSIEVIKNENGSNLRQVNGILEDKEKEWIFLNGFSLFNYKQNWNFILVHNSTLCVDIYQTAIFNMEVANNLITMINNLNNIKVTLPTERQIIDTETLIKNYKMALETSAELIKPDLEFISSNCDKGF